jgi:hypothetical protein
MTVVNIDGPPAAISVNGVFIRELACFTPGLTVRPGENGAPDLPWEVMLTTREDADASTWRVDGSEPVAILVRRGGPMFETGPENNPGPGPITPCPQLHFEQP